MGLDTSYNNISEVLSLLQRHKQKIIVHNGDNYTNKFYNMINLDDNNKVSIKKNKVK
jgi:predicted Rossmann-fold nucleotide-binding protein